MEARIEGKGGKGGKGRKVAGRQGRQKEYEESGNNIVSHGNVLSLV